MKFSSHDRHGNPEAPLVIFGGTGRVGRRLLGMLVPDGRNLRVFARGEPDALRSRGVREAGGAWQGNGLISARNVEVISGDLANPLDLEAALSGAGTLVCCAPMVHVPNLVRNAERARVRRGIFLTSTRRFTRHPDMVAKLVMSAEEAIEGSSLRSIILRPTMIYGDGDDNVSALVRRVQERKLIPLPGGGKARLQPVYVEDVARAMALALEVPADENLSIELSGRDTLSMKELLEAIGFHLGIRPRTVPVPGPLAGAVAWIWAGIHPKSEWPGRILRSEEDRTFDNAEAMRLLGWSPRAFREGLDEVLRQAEPS